jgi:hypothetical protein
VPNYTAAVDIHVMPGGFHTEITADDVFAGALYDRGVHLFAFGGLGPLNDELGVARRQPCGSSFPDSRHGGSWISAAERAMRRCRLADAFPRRRIHGVDLGAPMLRYASARAASVGYDIHFSQQDATRTKFPDASFDLILDAAAARDAASRHPRSAARVSPACCGRAASWPITICCAGRTSPSTRS